MAERRRVLAVAPQVTVRPAPGMDWHTVAISAAVGAAGGSLATLIVSKLLPEASPGDGFTVRWLTAEGVERRLDFGEEERAALEKALELKPQFPDVQVIEVRRGRVVSIVKAGSARPQPAGQAAEPSYGG